MEINTGKLKKVGNWISAILLGNTRELIARIDERTNHMADDLKDIKPKVSDMSPKVDILWKDRLAPSNSPRQLNTRGENILEISGIKQIIESRKEELLKIVKEKNPTNAYDAEALILAIVNELPKHYPDIVSSLKDGAFKSGIDINGLLFVGGIHLRNLLFKDLGFDLGELDKPKNG